MKLKKVLLFILMIISLFTLVGCGSVKFNKTLYIGRILTQTNNSLKNNYSKFEGSDTYTIKVKNDGSIKVSVTSKEGTLTLKIYNKETKEEVYSGNISEDMNFTLNVKSGTYIVSMETEKHSGGINLSW